MEDRLLEFPGLDMEYLEIVSRETLDRIENVTSETMIAVAGEVGGTRIIDNLWIHEENGALKVDL